MQITKDTLSKVKTACQAIVELQTEKCEIADQIKESFESILDELQLSKKDKRAKAVLRACREYCKTIKKPGYSEELDEFTTVLDSLSAGRTQGDV